MDEPRTNPNITLNTPGLIRLCRLELQAARERTEATDGQPATEEPA